MVDVRMRVIVITLWEGALRIRPRNSQSSLLLMLPKLIVRLESGEA